MKPKIWKNYYDIVILPSPKIRDYAIALSKNSKKFGSTLILEKKGPMPHISLYHIPVKPKYYKKFIADLSSAIKKFKTGNLSTENAILWKPHKTILLMTNKPQWIKNLYMKIIEATKKYFDWSYGVEKIWEIKKLNGVMKNNFKLYGTPMVGKYFIPHITFARFPNTRSMTTAYKNLKFKPYMFKPNGVFVCEGGLQCYKIKTKINF